MTVLAPNNVPGSAGMAGKATAARLAPAPAFSAAAAMGPVESRLPTGDDTAGRVVAVTSRIVRLAWLALASMYDSRQALGGDVAISGSGV